MPFVANIFLHAIFPAKDIYFFVVMRDIFLSSCQFALKLEDSVLPIKHAVHFFSPYSHYDCDHEIDKANENPTELVAVYWIWDVVSEHVEVD